jgi:short-subunit dehydrogenase
VGAVKWAGAVTVITGASRGIGRSVAIAAAERGARVGLIARTTPDLETVLKECGGRGAIATADVSDRGGVQVALASLEAELGPPDILVANAGLGSYGTFAECDLDDVDRLMKVNLLGTIYALRMVIPGMIERRRGHIVVMASIAGRLGVPLESIYSASKFGQVGLAEAVGFEVAEYGIKVSTINPGPVDTDFDDVRGHPYDRSFPKAVPPSDVAAAVIDAVEHDRPQTFVPRWLGPSVVIRHTLPGLYRWGTQRSYK